MNPELRILILEDSATDAELVERELRKAGISFISLRVETRDAFVTALDEFTPDIVLSDFRLPSFDGKAALEIVQQHYPDMPVIMVTGVLTDIKAVDMIHAGARDYVLKDGLARLAPAIRRALTEAREARERQAAEQALRESEARFRSLVENSSDWIWETDEQAVYTYSSPRVYDLLGYTAEDIIGKTPFDLMRPDEAARIKAKFDTVATDMTPFRLWENINLHKDGREVCLETSGSPLIDDQRRLKGFRGIDRDITERKRDELAQRRLNRELRAISSCHQLLMRTLDEQTLLDEICRIICDEAGYRMTWVGFAEHDEAKTVRPVAWGGVNDGYLSSSQITWADTEHGSGPTGTAIRSEESVCIQDFAADAKAAPWRENALRRGYRSSISLALKNNNANTFGALTIYSTEPNAFTAAEIRLLEELASDLAFGITVIRDRAKLKQAEATRTQLAAIVEYSNDAIVGKTPEGIITHWNTSAERMYGYAAKEIIGKPVTTLAPPEHHTEIDQLLEKIRQGETVVNHESERIRKDGALIHVALTLSPIKDASGNITGISTIARDITETKRNAEELRRYKDHLEEEVEQRTSDLVLARNAAEAANLAKSVFLANMSHELRTPLNAILGFSSMMRRDPSLPESLRQNLDIVNRSGEHLLSLINDVLEMAKIEAGRGQLERRPLDFGSLVRDVADMMQLRAQEKSLFLQIDQSSLFPRYIVGDEARLRQILINLLGNAVKFTEQGGVTLRLNTRNNKISHLLIEVEDSGPGVAPEDSQRIFEPFVQLGDQGCSKGTGLGLTITRQFVQMMGGSISLESTTGKSSLFRVELPLTEVMAADIVPSKPPKTGDVVGLAPGHPEYRILIVEDQLENQLLLAKLMESLGFQVKIAETGKQGVELFSSWHPHLIWMDRRMPVMDGLEATRHIRSLPGGKQVKIVAVTASAFNEQRSESLDAGMDDFVCKPYRFNEIYDCLARQLDVRYVYQSDRETEAQPLAFTPEILAVLPEELRGELSLALQSLNTDGIEQIIEQVAAYDPKLQQILAKLAENFDYPAILKALRASQSNAD